MRHPEVVELEWAAQFFRNHHFSLRKMHESIFVVNFDNKVRKFDVFD